MIPTPMNESVEAELFISFFYLVAVAWFLLFLFGLFRTLATKLPIPSGASLGMDLDPDLHPADFCSPKLYSFSSPSRKWVKAAVQLAEAMFAGLCAYVLLRMSANAQMDWLGWRLADEFYVWIGHFVLLAIAGGLLIERAITHANKFEHATINL